MLSLISNVSGRPWAIRGELAAHVHGLMLREGLPGLRHLVELKRDVHAFDDDSRPGARRGYGTPLGGGLVAVIPVIGTLTQRGATINSMGTRSTDAIANEVRSAAADPSVDAIVLEIDSPGGEVFGITEAAAAIREAGKVKPVVAHANSVAASAGYWLFSAASEGWVTPGGQIGSVGVYCLHVDASKAIEDMGEKWTFVSAGKFKVEGNPAEPLSDEARLSMQASVNRYYEMFTADVAKGRRVSLKRVQGGFGEGRMLGAQAAVEEKMADGVATLEQAIARAAELGRAKRSERANGGRASVAMPTWNASAAPGPAGPEASIGEAPGLTEGTPERSCATCSYYAKPAAGGSTGACSKFDATVADAWVCDAFEAPMASEPEEPADMSAERMAAAKLRGLLV